MIMTEVILRVIAGLAQQSRTRITDNVEKRDWAPPNGVPQHQLDPLG